MLASVLWVTALMVEARYDLGPSGQNTSNSLFLPDQSAFFLAQLGYLVLLTGLFRSKAAGDGLFGRSAVAIWWLAVAALVIGQFLGLFKFGPAMFLLPIGGLGQVLGSTLTAVATYQTGRWQGWRRFAPAVWAAYLIILLVSVIASIPVISMPDPSGSGAAPSVWAEAGWQIAWFVVGLALFIEAGDRRVSSAHGTGLAPTR